MKEDQHSEWKESWRDEYLKWICGFANAEGGVLVVGRNDAGVAVGVKDAKKLLEDIPNKVRDVLGIMVDVNLREEDGKELIEIRVEAYPYPASYKGEYHYRSGSTKQELKGAALDRFLLRKQGRHWDGVPVPFVSAADLDAKAWGRGIERIVAACAEANVPEPEFQVDPGGLWTIFGFAALTPEETLEKTPVEASSTIQETTQETSKTTQEPEKTTREKLLALLRNEPTLTRRELAERLGITADGVKYHLGKLTATGVIRHVGPTKAGHWEVLK